MDFGRSVHTGAARGGVESCVICVLDHFLRAEISAALREALGFEGISAPTVVLQGFGNASVRPVWAEKGWSLRGPWAFCNLQGGYWLRGSGQ